LTEIVKSFYAQVLTNFGLKQGKLFNWQPTLTRRNQLHKFIFSLMTINKVIPYCKRFLLNRSKTKGFRNKASVAEVYTKFLVATGFSGLFAVLCTTIVYQVFTDSL